MAALVAIPIAFIVSTPFAIIDYQGFTSFLEIQRQAYSLGHAGAEGASTSYGYYANALRSKFGLAPLVIAAVGLVALLRSRPRLAIVLAAFPLTFFAFMGAYRVHFDRNIVVLVPFCAVFAATALESAVAWAGATTRAPTRAVAIILSTTVASALAFSAYRQAAMSHAYTNDITLPHTRYLAKLWIEENLPAGASIAREHFTPPIDETRFEVTHLEYYGLLRATNLDRIDYLVTSSDDFGRFVFHADRYPKEAARYQEIFRRYRSVQRIEPEKGRSYGPVIIIYATKSTD